jgi:2',3'-cyclic-nucleotide 2'-phosphodiesterase
MRFLIFGDVVGELGRKAISRVLPQLREELQPDSVIINIENIAHGSGISPSVLPEVLSWKADVYTTGDHAWDNQAGRSLLENKNLPIIRPANYPTGVPGRGYQIVQSGAWQVAVINLQGQVFMKNHPLNPFWYIDELLEQSAIKATSIRLVDFHAEATSEKKAFGYHVDGRVAAVWGTHTHIPTADTQVMPKGTGYITDVGMNGGFDSIIGFDRVHPLKGFLQQIPVKFSPATTGPLEVNALQLDIDPATGKTTHIASIRKIVNDN